MNGDRYFALRVHDGGNTAPPPARKGRHLQSAERTARLVAERGPAARVYAVNRSAIARELNRGRQTVGRWANGEGVPSPRDLPHLATLLHVDLAELTRIVAADAERIERNRTAA